jgi:O-methyltransferase
LVRKFVKGNAGMEYGLTRHHREKLVTKFQYINDRVQSATLWPAYIIMAENILNIPRSKTGDVIECGCFKGASTSALSLLCSMTGRKLIVCDSFAGLPEDSVGAKHEYPHVGISNTYRAGEFAGRLDEVKSNIAAAGSIESCEFVPGFFSDSLKSFSRPLVFAFFDVDLRSSMEDCLRNLWPCLCDGSAIFTDDSCDMDVVKVWFDAAFWHQLSAEPPGYIGSGCGLPGMSSTYSSLGYVVKNQATLPPSGIFSAVLSKK